VAQEQVNLYKPLSEIRGASYFETIKDQLSEERATKASLEQRGVTIVTTSGVLATLLFGFGAFVYGQKTLPIGPEGTGFLISALVLFVIAGAFGLLATQPGEYREADIDKLKERTEPTEWHKDTPAVAARRDARLLLVVLGAYRAANGKKARRVYAGISAEVLSAVCVASSNSLGAGVAAIALGVLAAVGLTILWTLLRRSMRSEPPPSAPSQVLQSVE
jgi:O-antigen/teichoic acid export membrane protein